MSWLKTRDVRDGQITAAKLAAGAVGAASLAANALAATVAGRAIMQTGYFDAATFEAKFAANSIAASAASRAKIAAGFFDSGTVDSKFATNSIGEDRLTPNELHGRVMANGATTAVGAIPATACAIPMVIALAIPDAVSGNNDFTNLPFKCRVIDAWVQNTAAGNVGNTYTVQTGAGSAVTSAMASAGGDNDIGRTTKVYDATSDFAAGATLRVAHVKAGGSSAAIVYVSLLRIA